MIFQTPVQMPTAAFELNEGDGIVSMGSCFADNFGAAYASLQLPVWANPFGTVFNVVSLYDVLQGNYTPEYQLYRDELFVDYRYHTDIHAASAEELTTKIKDIYTTFVDFLKKANCMIITQGTSWVYRLKSTQKIVANCHKQPADLFEKILVDEQTQSEYLDKIVVLLRDINPTLQIVLTVSPVRHIKDGMSENSVSKALLRVLTHKACERHGFVHYFPSYEIMIDELRDYRYYAADLLHPSAVAVEHVLGRFEEVYFSKAYQENVRRRLAIKTALNHRPLNPTSASHLRFLENLEKEINAVGWQK